MLVDIHVTIECPSLTPPPMPSQDGARCVQWASPDAVQLVQLLLLASGFQNVTPLASALTDVWREIQLLVCSVSVLCVLACYVCMCVHV